jgi:hypothetical protein
MAPVLNTPLTQITVNPNCRRVRIVVSEYCSRAHVCTADWEFRISGRLATLRVIPDHPVNRRGHEEERILSTSCGD